MERGLWKRLASSSFAAAGTLQKFIFRLNNTKKENIVSLEDEENNLLKEKETGVAKTVFDDLIEQKEEKLQSNAENSPLYWLTRRYFHPAKCLKNCISELYFARPYRLEFQAPNDDILIETLGSNEITVLRANDKIIMPDSPENIVLNEILNIAPEIDYQENSEFLYNLIGQAFRYIQREKSYDAFLKIIVRYKKDIADEIYSQIMRYCSILEPQFDVKLIKAVSEIVSHGYSKYKEDDIAKFTDTVPAYEIKHKVFGGFSKACHT